jgi:uncharacterized membrane protein YfcA
MTSGSIVQGSVGFGLGLLAAPLLILIEPDFVPGPLLLAALFLNIFISHRERNSVDTPSLKWLIPGRILGTIIAALLIKFLPEQTISILFGGLVLLAAVMSISGLHLSLIPGNLFSVGTLSGFMATTTGIGGPPLALLLQRKKGAILRGTLAAIFLVGTFMAVLALAIIGRFGLKELILSILLFPAVVVGFIFSGRISGHVDKGYTRIAVLTISIVSAVVVIIKEVF